MRGLGLGMGLGPGRGVAGAASAPLPVHEDLDLTDWTKTNTVTTFLGEADPETGAASTIILETITDGTHRISKNYNLVNGVVYRYRLVLKANGRTKIALYTQGGTKYWMGTIGGTIGDLVLNISEATSTSLGNGWYIMEWTTTYSGTTGASDQRLALSLTPLDTSYVGDVTKGILVGSYKIFTVP